LDGTVVANVNIFEQYGVLHLTVDDTAGRNDTVTDVGAGIIFCRRQVVYLGIYVRILFEEVVPDILFEEIHVGPVIRIHSGDVAPVSIQLISVDLADIFVTDKDVFYEIMPVFLGTALQNLDEMPSSYDIHADGDIV